MHLAVSDPAVDGKGVDVSLGGFHFHFGREPGVLREHEDTLLVQFNQKQLPDGHRAGHREFGHLREGKMRLKPDCHVLDFEIWRKLFEVTQINHASRGRDEGRTAALMKAAGPLRLMSRWRSLSPSVPSSLIKTLLKVVARAT